MSDPRSQVLAVEGLVKEICRASDLSPPEAIMMCLTAAAHMVIRFAKPGVDIEEILATALGSAIVSAKDFFADEGEES